MQIQDSAYKMRIPVDKERFQFKTPALIGLMFLAFVLLVLRRPDLVVHAQPWAEDGKIWMAGIYNEGFWSSLLLPQNGYYQTISRLTYGISLLFGFSHAALVANIIAILIRCFFVGFILSSRMNFIDMKFRVVAALYLILMPNIAEGFVNITNVHWYLSMYLLAVVMANDAESTLGKVHDFAVLIISGLSGPFVVFIAPCLLLKRIYTRGGIIAAIRQINMFDIVMATCCVIQVAAILISPDTARSSAPLGASVGVLIKIISYRIIGGTFFNNDVIAFMPENNYLCLILFVLFLISLVYLLIKSGWQFKAAAIFPVLMIGFALAKPMMSITDPQWPVFFGPGNGERYFFVTNFAFFCFVLYLLSKMTRYKNMALVVLSLVTLATVSSGFRIPKLANVGYQEDLVKFENARQGEHVTLRINPPGWTMELIKK
ncbi:hypothetical protein [Pantoea sp. At-9b]|uniref:hypothetical protein n=1 Tax=Pantoea sp. (strain At-9b) TaxID=592316 RepID=UPI0001B40A66|nr:hypothetical protein [Pantoea sp. At-9b]ADU69860.1 serotype-specific glucosyl transferase [Pantoea sp. At-9b]